MEMIVFLLLGGLVMGLVGYAVGNSRGRGMEGFFLGFFFSLLGVIIVLLLEPRRKEWSKTTDRGRGSLARVGGADGVRAWEAQGKKAFLDPLEEAEFREWQAQRAAGHVVPPPAFMAGPGLKVPENWAERQRELAAEEERLDERFR